MKQFDYSPLYRKIIFPWYDTEAAHFILIGFMGLVFLFSIAGFSVVRENIEFYEYVWVPFLLMILSILVIVSVLIRLIKRYIYKLKDRDLKNFNKYNFK